MRNRESQCCHRRRQCPPWWNVQRTFVMCSILMMGVKVDASGGGRNNWNSHAANHNHVPPPPRGPPYPNQHVDSAEDRDYYQNDRRRGPLHPPNHSHRQSHWEDQPHNPQFRDDYERSDGAETWRSEDFQPNSSGWKDHHDTQQQKQPPNTPRQRPEPREQLSNSPKSKWSWLPLRGKQARQSPRPIQPLPIHYQFHVREDTEPRNDATHNSSQSPAQHASPRKDVITTYMSTTSGKLRVIASSTVTGMVLGAVLAKWTHVGDASVLIAAAVGGFLFFLSTWFRTPVGELARALGLCWILVLQRTTDIRRRYPTWQYVGASFRNMFRRKRMFGPRPFPPARNPWKYTRQRSTDVPFSMLYCLVTMALVGSACGSNVPLIPTWIGALVGASLAAYSCTLVDDPRGDLCRTMGMRVVAVLQELWTIQEELAIIPKVTVVVSQLVDKAMIFDRQHRVKDRFLTLMNRGYERVMQMAAQVREQQRQPTEGNYPEQRDFASQSQGTRSGAPLR